ncbi:hypothetical protein K144316041_09360 [Clostridium tetani]|uniref:hypothetical protein n=1 Tax=Clostridium tetani TaxID=1513 RepID=UPI002953190C|nr:hypothetical protein [Clostridium tetani]BDR72228.1 hypothetical protein K144316041_09360 [Clostridium tetani]
MSLSKYIINFEELADELKKRILKLIDDELKSKYSKLNTNDIEGLLEDLKELLPSLQYNMLKKKIENFIYYNYNGMQKVDSKLLDIPPIIQENKEDFIFDKDVYLTGLHFNQTGWKKEDTYTLEINKNRIINNATIKEIGEHKYFNTFYKVNANTPISFILHNNSGNSRQTMVDLEYLIGEIVTPPEPPIEEPETPTIDDILNDWDIAVVMQWEANTMADIDLHAVIGDKYIYFGNKEEWNFFLNFDFRQHMTNQNPEILSVKGYKNKKLEIYIHNFDGIGLNEPVNLKVYEKRSYGNNLIKELNIDISPSRDVIRETIQINLNTLEIKEINRDINLEKFLGGR